MSTINLSCPVCQHKSQKDMITYIDTSKNPELVGKLLMNELYFFECSNCGAKRQLEVQMVFHDPEEKVLLINLANQDYTEKLKDNLMKYIPSNFDLSDYDLRLVRNIPELVEKIQILQFGKASDSIIEIVKLLTDGLFMKQKPDAQILNRFFTIAKGAPKIYYILEDEQFFVDYNDSLQEFAEEKYKKAAKETPKGEFITVNQKWAVNLLEGK
ncbi:CpXC domain-containing protein [Aerococcaceae bacterium DSM 111022]|nr:CpXC domain-containing protein [Aerococcaceae bacterium DSM 111022]